MLVADKVFWAIRSKTMFVSKTMFGFLFGERWTKLTNTLVHVSKQLVYDNIFVFKQFGSEQWFVFNNMSGLH